MKKRVKIPVRDSGCMDAAISVVRTTHDVLAGVHPHEMKALGAWCFDVLDNRTTHHAEEAQTPEKV